jgi:hypothetical protein
MKKIAILILLSMFCVLSWAQVAHNSMIEYNKTKVPGVVISLTTYDLETVKAALKARLERVAGLKGTSSKGFTLYADQVFFDFGSKKFDIYTKIDAGSKKDQDVIISLMVSTGNENFVSMTDNPELNQKMLDFLTDFVANSLKDYEATKNINEQTAALEKMEKEHKTLVADRDKLKLDLEKTEKALTTKEEEIAKIKRSLELLKQ